MSPVFLYSAEQIRNGEREAAKLAGIEMYQLMLRAGHAVFDAIARHYPNTRHLGVICGGGNNGGDGYVVATLALKAGIQVSLWHIGDPSKNTGDAKTAQQAWLDAGGEINPLPESMPMDVDLLVDALLGTGLSGNVREDARHAIDMINHYPAPVVAVDAPSGLCADTGRVLGKSVKATLTVTFIGHKLGLHTGKARHYRGVLQLADLGVGMEFAGVAHSNVQLLDQSSLPYPVIRRKATAHKGDNGRVLMLGGGYGMPGAIRLASEACARCGAGMTKVVTHHEHVESIVVARPEIMVSGWQNEGIDPEPLFAWADCLVIGPGLGQEVDAQDWFDAFISQNLPKVVDADGLNLLAKHPFEDGGRILTPHPGEASRLLGCTVAEIESDRYKAAEQLQQKYGGVVVLKGAGTLICDGEHTWVCSAGNQGMASAGMGDVLSGVLGAMLAQGLPLSTAACCGVWLHSAAADHCAAEDGEIGLLASDLFPHLRYLLNH